MIENEQALTLRALARAMDRAIGQIARDAKQPGFPKHQSGGKVIFYRSEVELWRHRNIKERPRRRSPAPALEARDEIDWRQAITVKPEQLRDGGLLPARKLFGDRAGTLKASELDELSRWMSYAVAELLVDAAQKLHGTADILERAPVEYYATLIDSVGDRAIADALNGMAWHWAGQRHPEWQPVSTTKAGDL